MIRRTTWIILAIFIVLLGIAWYFLQIKPVSPTPVSTNQPPTKLLTGLNTAKIAAIKYVDNQGIQISLELQTNQQWAQKSPSNTSLSQGNIQEIITQLLDINILVDLATPPAIEDVGLNQPANTLVITTEKDIVLSVGNSTPTGNGYYVQVDKMKPVIIAKPGVDRIVELFKSTQNTPTPTSTGY